MTKYNSLMWWYILDTCRLNWFWDILQVEWIRARRVVNGKQWKYEQQSIVPQIAVHFLLYILRFIPVTLSWHFKQRCHGKGRMESNSITPNSTLHLLMTGLSTYIQSSTYSNQLTQQHNNQTQTGMAVHSYHLSPLPFPCRRWLSISPLDLYSEHTKNQRMKHCVTFSRSSEEKHEFTWWWHTQRRWSPGGTQTRSTTGRSRTPPAS